jgi:cytochrome c oxidase subunit 3
MALFLVSLSILFAASLVGYLVVRQRAARWVPEGTPPLPWGLWLSTLVLVISSGTMHGALLAIRGGRQQPATRALAATLALGILFLLTQVWNWWRMVAVDAVLPTGSLYGFTFYVLTVLHALHVVGGLVPLALTTAKSSRGAYSWADFQGVRLTGMYWHFLGVVWLVLFAVLELSR